MAIGRITGPMLYSNLDRQGVSLQVDTDLVFFDVTNRRLGINKTNPGYSLDVNGNAHLGNLLVLGNTISSETGKIGFGEISTLIVSGGSLNNVIITDGAGNLSFTNIGSLPDLVSANTAVATLNANVGAYQTYANANAATQETSINTITANLGAYQTFANSQISTIDSNIGAYETWANATFATNTIETQLSANVGAYQIWANASAYSNANVATYLPTYTGNLYPGNVTSAFYGNVHTDYISANTGNVITVLGTGAIKIPVGTTSDRPVGANGYVRFNTDTPSLEYFNAINNIWVPVTNTVTDQQITPDGISTTYTLDQATTDIGIIVSINGVLQRPTAAYTVIGNQITFNEIPDTTDIVDIRFLGASVTINNTLSDNLIVAGNITLSGILQAPATTKTSTDPGTAGQVCWDSGYIYICTATNTWKRVALTGGVF